MLRRARPGPLAVVMIARVIPGTLLGKRLQPYVSERQFIAWYRVALMLAGAKVALYDGLWKLVGDA